MTIARFAAGAPGTPALATEYRPGICNIGPAEIARRRRAGHYGLAAAVVLYGFLLVVGAPPIARLLVAVPAALAAVGYLQARFKFCAGFASRGVFNFGEVGPVEHVADAEARQRDRARARQIALAAFGIGIFVGVIAVLVPR